MAFEGRTDEGRLVLAIDQGTSATKAVLVDESGRLRGRASVSVSQSHPLPGWAEQDAIEIWDSVRRAVGVVLADEDPARVAAVGLSTQRESALLWNRHTGQPLAPLRGWQDTRGADLCARLRRAGYGERVRSLTGLPLDAMFSAAKAAPLLDQHDPDRSRSRRGELCLGTVDSWLLFQLGREHLIEVGNASRTQLLNIQTRDWDPWLLDLFNIPAATLPRVVCSTGPFTGCERLGLPGRQVLVTGVLGDSHAALFAHAGWRPGRVKATYGTGSSVMGIASGDRLPSTGVARTIAWELAEPSYAFEGNVRSSGATLVWLADLLGTTPAEIASLAADDSAGVSLVPAFSGLGAPWWDDQAQAAIFGLSASSGTDHIARAALESIAFQVEDVATAIDTASGGVRVILADGGASTNAALMQLQADTSGRPVRTSEIAELSAVGAAHLAGVGAGIWSLTDLEALPRDCTIYDPRTREPEREARLARWHSAIRAVRTASAGDADQHHRHALAPSDNDEQQP